MSSKHRTDIGGAGEAFLTTHWSLVEGIQSDTDRDQALVGLLLKRYWKPAYCYLRRKGHDNEEAKDLTQGFFHEVVLNRQLVRRADQDKGRFRSFLLHALNQYVSNERAKQNAKKRIPREKLLPLDMTDPPALSATVSEWNPEDAYHYAWLSGLLDQILAQVRQECLDQGMDTHWQVFHSRLVGPILADAPAPTWDEICQEYGLRDTKTAFNMMTTVKRRFQAALQRTMRDTVTSEAQMQEEFQEIMQWLPKGAGTK